MKKRKRIAVRRKTGTQKRRRNPLKAVCWIAVPVAAAALLALDALGIYTFNGERLLVLGVGLLVIMLPFFSEITLKGLTLKQEEKEDGPDTTGRT